jgi:hypothetical protein
MTDASARSPLAELVDHTLFDTDDFVGRHVGPTRADQRLMLDVVGATDLDALLAETVPGPIADGTLPLPGPRAVHDVLAELRHIASLNTTRRSLIGMGYHGTRTPPSSSATCSRTPPGTRRTRRTSRRSARAGSRRCSTSRRWWPT